MFFEVSGFQVDVVEDKDLDGVIEVYNSNKNFLISHMNQDKISTEWMTKEIESMREIGFYCCKIVEVSSGKIVGIMDFEIGEETYLSILIIHSDYKKRGVGRIVYSAFEEYALSLNSKRLRIDVVTNYDNSVMDFWSKNGFINFNNIKLNWTGKVLPAVTMKKDLLF